MGEPVKYVSTFLAVRAMAASKRFYHGVLGLDVISDFGANITLTGGISLQTLDTWKEFIGGKDVKLRSNAVELYFEETDFDTFTERLRSFNIEYVHDVKEHGWGQRVVRFYDPDGHIIEVGEAMETVVKRFRDSGMTDGQVAERMDVPLEYVRGFPNRR